jgi:hypothetical protein
MFHEVIDAPVDMLVVGGQQRKHVITIMAVQQHSRLADHQRQGKVLRAAHPRRYTHKARAVGSAVLLASSSRSQIAVRAACTAARLASGRPPVSVHWRPPLSVAIVTHLVTRLPNESVVELGTGNVAIGAHSGCGSECQRGVYLGFDDRLVASIPTGAAH